MPIEVYISVEPHIFGRKRQASFLGNILWVSLHATEGINDREMSISKQNIMCPSLSQNVAHWCNDSIFDNSRFHLRFSLSSPKKFFPFTFVVSSLVLRLIFDCRTKKQRRENEGRTKGERRTNENLSRIEREHIENLSISKTHNFSWFFVVCTFTYQFHEGVVSFTMC